MYQLLIPVSVWLAIWTEYSIHSIRTHIFIYYVQMYIQWYWSIVWARILTSTVRGYCIFCIIFLPRYSTSAMRCVVWGTVNNKPHVFGDWHCVSRNDPSSNVRSTTEHEGTLVFSQYAVAAHYNCMRFINSLLCVTYFFCFLYILFGCFGWQTKKAISLIGSMFRVVQFPSTLTTHE